MKKLVVFDLDGTLAESKAAIDAEMSAHLIALLSIVKVAIISGGDWPQFEKQVLSHLADDGSLIIFPSFLPVEHKFYEYKSNGHWSKIYSEDFTSEEKEKIIGSLKKAVGSAGVKAAKTCGSGLKTGEVRLPFPR